MKVGFYLSDADYVRGEDFSHWCESCGEVCGSWDMLTSAMLTGAEAQRLYYAVYAWGLIAAERYEQFTSDAKRRGDYAHEQKSSAAYRRAMAVAYPGVSPDGS